MSIPVLAAPLLIHLPVTVSAKGNDGPGTRVPDTKVGDLNGTPSSQLHAVVAICGVNPRMEDLFLSESLTLSLCFSNT